MNANLIQESWDYIGSVGGSNKGLRVVCDLLRAFYDREISEGSAIRDVLASGGAVLSKEEYAALLRGCAPSVPIVETAGENACAFAAVAQPSFNLGQIASALGMDPDDASLEAVVARGRWLGEEQVRLERKNAEWEERYEVARQFLIAVRNALGVPEHQHMNGEDISGSICDLRDSLREAQAEADDWRRKFNELDADCAGKISDFEKLLAETRKFVPAIAPDPDPLAPACAIVGDAPAAAVVEIPVEIEQKAYGNDSAEKYSPGYVRVEPQTKPVPPKEPVAEVDWNARARELFTLAEPNRAKGPWKADYGPSTLIEAIKRFADGEIPKHVAGALLLKADITACNIREGYWYEIDQLKALDKSGWDEYCRLLLDHLMERTRKPGSKAVA